MKLKINNILNKINISNARRHYLLILFVAAGLSLIKVTLAVSAIIISAVIIILLPLGNKGLITRTILYLALVASFNTILGLIFWGLKIPLSAQTVVWIYLLFGLILVTYGEKLKQGRFKLFPKIDIYASIAGIICLTLLLSPLYKHTDNISLLRVVGVGVDNIAHLRLVRMTDGLRGYAYGNKDEIRKEMIKDISAYPQGTHLNIALAEGIIWPTEKIHTVRQTLLGYLLFAAVIYSAVVYLFTYIVLYLSDKLGFRRRGVAPSIAILTSIYLFESLLIDMYWLGFLTQIFSTFLMLTLLIFLFDSISSDGHSTRLTYILFGLLVCIGIGFSYAFTLPVALASTGGVALYLLVKKKMIANRATFVSIIILSCVSLVPLWIQATFMQQSNKLNDQGGAVIFDGLIIAALAVLAIFCFGYLRKQNKAFGVPQYVLVCAFGFMSAIFLYQQITVGGKSSYYFYKSTYLVIILTVLAISILAISLLQNVKADWQIIMIIAGLGLILWQTRGQTLKVFESGTAYRFSVGFAATINKLITEPNYVTKSTKIISLGNNCRLDDDLYLMRFVTAFSGDGDLDQAEIAHISFFPDDRRNIIYDLITKYQIKQSDKKLIIVTSSETIRQNLALKLGGNIKNVEFIKPTADSPPSPTYCEP